MDKHLEFLKAPLLLSPNRFTPVARTPWGSKVIGERYKSRVDATAPGKIIGESWEVSCDPDLLSTVEGRGETLASLIQQFPEALLSRGQLQRNIRECQILVKLLSAASPLSLQVHPADGASHLAKDECGKPESWYVLDCEPGAGLYLGFSMPTTKPVLREMLLSSPIAVQERLQFVPVQPGDYFEIGPGVTHAIGPGVTLLEPQRVLAGKKGKTLRLWDWGRRYGEGGSVDQKHGQARPLHIDEGLDLIDPEHQVGVEFVDSLRRKANLLSPKPGIFIREFPANPYYQLFHFSMETRRRITLEVANGFAAAIPLQGAFDIDNNSCLLPEVPVGQPFFLGAAAFPISLTATEPAEIACLIPAGAGLIYQAH